MRFTIQTKLFVLMVSLTAAILGGVLFSVEGILSRAIQAKIVYDFNKTPKSHYVGYVTSFMFSPLMKKHIAIAKIVPSHAKRGEHR